MPFVCKLERVSYGSGNQLAYLQYCIKLEFINAKPQYRSLLLVVLLCVSECHLIQKHERMHVNQSCYVICNVPLIESFDPAIQRIQFWQSLDNITHREEGPPLLIDAANVRIKSCLNYVQRVQHTCLYDVRICSYSQECQVLNRGALIGQDTRVLHPLVEQVSIEY